jgi:amino acid transporter
MRLAFGRTGEVLIVAVVAVTAITVMNAILIAGARTTYAAARDLGFARLGTWDASRGVPRGALFGLAGISLALVGLGLFTRGGFSTLVDYLSPVYWGFLMLSGVAVILLRRRDPERLRAFRVPLYPLLPLLFSASCAYLLYSSLVYVRQGALVAVAVLSLGALLWVPLRRRAQP